MTISHREFHQAANRKRPGFNDRLPKRKLRTPERHKRKCVICNHPERAEIEADFLRWRSPERIAEEYKIANQRSIYRHVHATGIYALRRLKFRCATELIVEKAEGVAPNADAVIRAIRAASMIDSRGQWREPRRVVIYSREPEDNSEGESRSPQPVHKSAATPGSVTVGDAPPADAPGLTFSTDGNRPPSVELEQGVSLKISRRGVRSNSNRQILVRLESGGND
jgi:hypothetical protein